MPHAHYVAVVILVDRQGAPQRRSSMRAMPCSGPKISARSTQTPPRVRRQFDAMSRA